MLLPSFPIRFRKRRGRSKAAKATPTPPPAALEIVGIEDLSVVDETLTVTIVFNTTEENPINDVGGADPEKFSARYLNLRYGGITMSKLAYNQLQINMIGPGGDDGGNEIRYTNAPSDISDALGRELPACWFNF